MDAARRKRRPLPEWYLNRPEMPPNATFYMKAYRDLVTCRMPDGAIPWDKVQLYADRKGLDQDVADLLWDAIRAMDYADLKWRSDEAKRNTRDGAKLRGQEDA